MDFALDIHDLATTANVLDRAAGMSNRDAGAEQVQRHFTRRPAEQEKDKAG